MPQLVKHLTGGSLNATDLFQDQTRKFVRKRISTIADREYGYVRWYSQLKKLQRFSELVPDLVPEIYNIGVDDQGAYFDIEYIDAKDVKTLFKNNCLDEIETEILHKKLWSAFDLLHQNSYPAIADSLRLYFQEEVLQKINDARQFPEFDKFYNVNSYTHQGNPVTGIKNNIEKIAKLFDQPITAECYVHGNSTLENILYSSTNGIVFIDLYEEGIIDSALADYSQILQCSNSHYGLLNDSDISVEGSIVECLVTIPDNLCYFNQLFTNELKSRLDPNEYFLVKLFEATQFFRMLPFKCHTNKIDYAKFFYVHACKLINELL